MGDRGNVKIADSGVYLYTHWSGTDLPVVVQAVLRRKDRWGDHPYLARMIFSEMTAGKETCATGFGISTELIDPDHPIIIINCAEQSVTFEGKVRWRFDDYVALSEEQLQKAYVD